MRRLAAPVVAALLAIGLVGPGSALAAPRTAPASSVPKVVIVVGPAGAATDGYRAEGRAAAAVARRYTPDVVELYSPNATWPAVQDALDGASLVVYMGHGNGWPSRYRNDLFPPTQNGLGLNPVAGGNDDTHQYFGEAYLASKVKLAKNAVVLLNHLCYASGLSEPELPEGTLAQARQRVDNYAAGFIDAGASAVIAEAYASPSNMIRQVLGGGRSIESAWRSAPSANGHLQAFPSTRSPGYVAEMDTETGTSGFSRSIVLKSGLVPSEVLSGARGTVAGPSGLLPAQPTLATSGIKLATPDITDLPTAGATVHLKLPFTIADRKNLPAGLSASVRFDPLDPVAVIAADPAAPASPDASAAPDASGAPGASAAPDGSPAPKATDAPPAVIVPAERPRRVDAADDASPAATPSPTPTPIPTIELPAAPVDLVVPEETGDVVAPAPAKIGKTFMSVPVTLPSTPGRYLLTITLADADGVAYDAATQAAMKPLIVRVTGDFDGSIVAAPKATLAAGSQAALAVRVINLGTKAWGRPAIHRAGEPDGDAPAAPAVVVGRWLPLSADASLAIGAGGQTASTTLPIGLAPHRGVNRVLDLNVPDAPGEYLLLLDVVTPDRGSLVATGAQPTLVRITVTAGS